jgi:hypothetical protein
VNVRATIEEQDRFAQSRSWRPVEEDRPIAYAGSRGDFVDRRVFGAGLQEPVDHPARNAPLEDAALHQAVHDDVQSNADGGRGHGGGHHEAGDRAQVQVRRRGARL